MFRSAVGAGTLKLPEFPSMAFDNILHNFGSMTSSSCHFLPVNSFLLK